MGFNRQDKGGSERGLVLTLKLGEFIEVTDNNGKKCRIHFLNHCGGQGKFKICADKNEFAVVHSRLLGGKDGT